jgi:hypothetical protein
MMRGAARLNDKTIGNCSIHGPNIKGKIITSSPDIDVNGRGLARLGDKVLADCGHVAEIITASSTEDPNNKRGTARLNDKVGNSPYRAKIITASTDSFPNPG